MSSPGMFVRHLLTWFGAAVLPTAAAPAAYDSYDKESVILPMRDGVKLSTDIYRPARGGKQAEGKFPVLIERTPYGKGGRSNVVALLTQRGYVVVLQDCRGRYLSEGDFYPFVNEGQDGYDTIEWAAAQSWSDGRVGTFGGSYTGWDQYFAAMLRPPHLGAMFTQMAGAALYEEVPYPGGAPNSAWPLWILRSALTSYEAKQHPAAVETMEHVRKSPYAWLQANPQKRGEIFNEFPAYKKVYEDFYSHPLFDGYWKQRGFYTAGYFREMKDVPMLFVSGWYDFFLEGVLQDFAALSRMQKTEKKLMVGPWPHGIGTGECGDASFGGDTAEDQGALIADWFDHWMGRSTGFGRIGSDPVRIFRMGGGDGSRTGRGKLNHGGEWLAASAWPPSGVHPAKYYIHDNGVLGPDLPKNDAPSSFEFDPQNPVPTIGGRAQVAGTPTCVQDQVCSPRIPGCKDSLPLNRRADVLSYSTPPLARPVEVTGSIQARLWVSSDAPDTDFTAKLMDVYPSGYAVILADGELRARYRDGFDAARLLKPQAVYAITIRLGSTSNLFATGHRIRLDISSSNFPKFEPNPNTGEANGAWTRQVKAHNAVYHDAKNASYVELPTMERK